MAVTGPADEIDHIVVDHGVIREDFTEQWLGWRHWRSWGRSWVHGRTIRIVVTAPRLSDVDVSGSGRLDLGRLAQDRLDLGLSGSGEVSVSGAIRIVDVHVSGSGGARLTGLSAGRLDAGVSGSGWVAASGAAESLRLSISGSGSGDFSGLNLQDLQASLSGSGSAKAAPRRSADIGVSGSGSVRLLTQPTHLVTHRSGSGRIIQANGGG